MKNNPLGKKKKYITKYNTNLLFAIKRSINRNKNDINPNLFTGYDVWNAYELSWLDKNGKPQVSCVRIIYPASSANIVESKSLKLYFVSFNMTKFDSKDTVKQTIKTDLSKLLDCLDVDVILYSSQKKIKYKKIQNNLLLDNIDLTINNYKPSKNLLQKEKCNKKIIERYSNLLRSNCPITGQPDWATIHIKYKAVNNINDESLLRYIVSYREHSDYHESVCEKIFSDLFEVLQPEFLFVKCFFTRRGGIEINPIRFYGNIGKIDTDFHYWRQ